MDPATDPVLDPALRDRQRQSFGPAADLYDRVRPRYPADAIRWILEKVPAGATVVDLGAGTGILSRQIAALGLRVVPVEPDEQMRAKLADVDPSMAPLAGSAEAIPLPDGSVDAVLAGQAYHWFDHPVAHVEIARVLRAGGVFGPLWNERDESVAWVATLSQVAGETHNHDADHPGLGQLGTGGQFGPLEMVLFHQAMPHTPESLLELMRSRSWHLTASPERRAEMDAAILGLCATHPELAGKTQFDLPYLTRAYRTRRLP